MQNIYLQNLFKRSKGMEYILITKLDIVVFMAYNITNNILYPKCFITDSR